MRSRGFTLIEIAIAIAILGLGVVSALQVFGGSLRVARLASKKTEAVMHAKALLDTVLWQPELEEGVRHGEIGDGFRWERTIRPAGPEEGIEPSDYHGDVRLAVISVVVEWEEGGAPKAYRIGTMRVVPDYGASDG